MVENGKCLIIQNQNIVITVERRNDDRRSTRNNNSHYMHVRTYKLTFLKIYMWGLILDQSS
jgi:hypothetical protein